MQPTCFDVLPLYKCMQVASLCNPPKHAWTSNPCLRIGSQYPLFHEGIQYQTRGASRNGGGRGKGQNQIRHHYIIAFQIKQERKEENKLLYYSIYKYQPISQNRE